MHVEETVKTIILWEGKRMLNDITGQMVSVDWDQLCVYNIIPRKTT